MPMITLRKDCLDRFCRTVVHRILVLAVSRCLKDRKRDRKVLLFLGGLGRIGFLVSVEIAIAGLPRVSSSFKWPSVLK